MLSRKFPIYTVCDNISISLLDVEAVLDLYQAYFSNKTLSIINDVEMLHLNEIIFEKTTSSTLF